MFCFVGYRVMGVALYFMQKDARMNGDFQSRINPIFFSSQCGPRWIGSSQTGRFWPSSRAYSVKALFKMLPVF